MINKANSGDHIEKLHIPIDLIGYFIGIRGKNIEELRKNVPGIRIYISNTGEMQLIGEKENVVNAKPIVELEIKTLLDLYRVDNESEIVNKCFLSIKQYQKNVSISVILESK